MPTLNINGKTVNVGDDFLRLPPDQQNATVEEIAKSLGAAQPESPQPQLDPLQQRAADNRKYLGETVSNIPGSAVNMATDIGHAVAHPIETAENIGSVGKGVLQKLGVMSGNDSTQYADAAKKFLVDRYGSWDAATKSFHDDPVGVMADLSTVLTGGGSLAAKAPSIAGKIGEIAGTAGRVADPLNAVGKVAGAAGNVAAETIGGLTGTGGKSLRLAAEAGVDGGSKARDFLDNANGSANMGEVIADAKGALNKIRAERGSEYRAGMKDVGADTTVLDFNKINSAFQKVNAIKTYKGQSLSPTTAGIRADLSQTISDWNKLDPKEFHTPEGLDALKQKIGDIRDGTEAGSPSRVMANEVYNAVKQTIVDQAPKYANVMKGYEEASQQIREIESTLSLKPNASIDTSLRKLQSILRNNVNTNYGNRAKLADYIVSAGAPNLLTKLAGQSLSSWTPRGLGHVANAGELAFSLHELLNGNPKAAAAIAALLPASSPKLAGLTAFGLGAASRPAKPVTRSLFQAGRFGGSALGQTIQ